MHRHAIKITEVNQGEAQHAKWLKTIESKFCVNFTLISFPFAVKYFNFADNNLLKSVGAQYCSYKMRNLLASENYEDETNGYKKTSSLLLHNLNSEST